MLKFGTRQWKLSQPSIRLLTSREQLQCFTTTSWVSVWTKYISNFGFKCCDGIFRWFVVVQLHNFPAKTSTAYILYKSSQVSAISAPTCQIRTLNNAPPVFQFRWTLSAQAIVKELFFISVVWKCADSGEMQTVKGLIKYLQPGMRLVDHYTWDLY